jgi:arylsulfatase A-like enzyme
VFLGDNGSRLFSNAPLRGDKENWYEGGIRVPFILAWPGQVAGGRTYARPVMAFDLFATFLRAPGGTPAAVVDGVDLLPFLSGASGVSHRYLF